MPRGAWAERLARRGSALPCRFLDTPKTMGDMPLLPGDIGIELLAELYLPLAACSVLVCEDLHLPKRRCGYGLEINISYNNWRIIA